MHNIIYTQVHISNIINHSLHYSLTHSTMTLLLAGPLIVLARSASPHAAAAPATPPRSLLVRLAGDIITVPVVIISWLWRTGSDVVAQ